MKRFTLVSGALFVTLVAAMAGAQTTAEPQEAAALLEQHRAFQRMDRNQDGILESFEIPVVAKPVVQQLAREAGFKQNAPIPLDKLLQIHMKRIHDAAKKQQEVQQQEAARRYRFDLHTAPTTILRRLDRNRDGFLDAHEIPADARSFVADLARECGFGAQDSIALKQLTDIHMSRFDQLPENYHDGSGAHGSTSVLSKAEAGKFARSLIALYDNDDNRVLGRAEWDRIHSDWGYEDHDGDGTLTIDEVAARLVSLSRVAVAPRKQPD